MLTPAERRRPRRQRARTAAQDVEDRAPSPPGRAGRDRSRRASPRPGYGTAFQRCVPDATSRARSAPRHQGRAAARDSAARGREARGTGVPRIPHAGGRELRAVLRAAPPGRSWLRRDRRAHPAQRPDRQGWCPVPSQYRRPPGRPARRRGRRERRRSHAGWGSTSRRSVRRRLMDSDDNAASGRPRSGR